MVNQKSVWTAHRYAIGDPMDGGRAHIPTLKEQRQDRSIHEAETNKDKSRVLCEVFFPRLEHMAPTYEDAKYQLTKFYFVPVKDEQGHHVLRWVRLEWTDRGSCGSI